MKQSTSSSRACIQHVVKARNSNERNIDSSIIESSISILEQDFLNSQLQSISKLIWIYKMSDNG
jgi:hypothetical protein